MTTAQEFIDFFEAIPEENWTVGIGDVKAGKTCSYGHLKNLAGRPEWHLLADNFDSLLTRSAPEINDGKDKQYQQSTPKQRILAALRDAKEAGK